MNLIYGPRVRSLLSQIGKTRYAKLLEPLEKHRIPIVIKKFTKEEGESFAGLFHNDSENPEKNGIRLNENYRDINLLPVLVHELTHVWDNRIAGHVFDEAEHIISPYSFSLLKRIWEARAVSHMVGFMMENPGLGLKPDGYLNGFFDMAKSHGGGFGTLFDAFGFSGGGYIKDYIRRYGDRYFTQRVADGLRNSVLDNGFETFAEFKKYVDFNDSLNTREALRRLAVSPVAGEKFYDFDEARTLEDWHGIFDMQRVCRVLNIIPDDTRVGKFYRAQKKLDAQQVEYGCRLADIYAETKKIGAIVAGRGQNPR
jgi:hypothetical protein